METIHRSLDGAPLADIKVCDHIDANTEVGEGIDVAGLKQCANCSGYMCADCLGDAANCHSCPKIICEGCLATARKRACTSIVKPSFIHYDYLCAPCCAKQDAAR